MHATDIIGYTHSDGYCLCPEHGTDDQGNELPDPGNETGHVYPIFANAETDHDMICDACFTELRATGKDVRDAIILEANIGVDEEEESEDDGEEICCVCGKPAEGIEDDVCDCVCPYCGEDCFDDQTLTDHGMCYDCFQQWRRGERKIGEDE